jgi:2-dehydro-3-deoxy-D-arabinonate dehydratase
VKLHIFRQGATAFEGETGTSQLKRNLMELAGFLGRELEFPDGVLLLTGTGIVPPDDFTLEPGDCVRIAVGQLTLENVVED